MKLIPMLLLLIGAAIVYGGKPILKKANRRKPTDKELGVFKSIGLMIAFLGAMLIFTMK